MKHVTRGLLPISGLSSVTFHSFLVLLILRASLHHPPPAFLGSNARGTKNVHLALPASRKRTPVNDSARLGNQLISDFLIIYWNVVLFLEKFKRQIYFPYSQRYLGLIMGSYNHIHFI